MTQKKTPTHQIAYAILLTIWVFLGIFFGQIFFSLIFALIPGNLLEQSVWATVYSALSYSLSLFIILYFPYKFPRRLPLATLILSAIILLYYLFILIQYFYLYLSDYGIGQSLDSFWRNFTFMGQLGFILAIFGIIFNAVLLSISHQPQKSTVKNTTKTAHHTDTTPTNTTKTTKSESITTTTDTNSSDSASTSRTALGLSGLPTWTDIGLAPIGYIASLILGSLLVAFFSVFEWFNVGEAQDVGFNSVYSGFDRLVTFIALVVIAPIAEEIIFRGWLYGKLRSFLNIPVSILIVSAFFGLMHGQWNVGITVFAMSVILCLAREFTGTIYSGIIMHMLKNGVAFILLYIVNVI